MLLVQYTIRSKQDYIFKTNRILDIVGASANITDAWDVLLEETEKLGYGIQRLSDHQPFHMQSVREAIQSGDIALVELFRGGGNETVLIGGRDIYERINREFSLRILREYPGMIPMAACVEIQGNYVEDYRNLMQVSEKKKNSMIPGRDTMQVPFAMTDRNTFQPFVGMIKYENQEVRVTAESMSKRRRGLELRDNNVKFLDSMTTDHGTEGLLAIIHADGNNMGVKIQEMLRGHSGDYDFCVNKMREFTDATAQAFVVNGGMALEQCKKELKTKYAGKYQEKAFAYRMVVADGDDVTFICNARFAMEYLKAYLDAVYNCREGEWQYSSCAGICIFHSHYPFARAYSLAEQCCDDFAKAMVHKRAEDGRPLEESWVDFHYIHSGIGGNLPELRERQGTASLMVRPWRLNGKQQDAWQDYIILEKAAKLLKDAKVARTSIKEIGSKMEGSMADGKRAYTKVCAHASGNLAAELPRLQPDEDRRMKMLYDLSEVYDLWFREV